MSGESTGIRQYFDDKSVFITGATGFIGKVVVEKLLRTCPGIKAIYFFIRPKKGLSCQERIDKLFTLPLFKTLNRTDPEARNKVIPIQGDITHKSLGMSDEDRRMLEENVNIIIHSAATVKFNEHIRVAMEMNLIAVKEIVGLAKSMKNLKVFLHVSTAYSQCNRCSSDPILEKFYPVTVEPDRLLEAMEWMNDEMLESLTKPLLDKYPNTYTFTKSLAEYYLQKECGNIPLAIVRPSIVTSSISDPVPGWVDNFNGICGMIVAISRGVVRSMHIPSGVKHDIVPVDFVSNCIISTTWYYGVTGEKGKALISNCTSGGMNPTSFYDLAEMVTHMYSAEHPLNSIFRRPNFKPAPNRLINQYWQVFSHYIPAIILDGLSMITGTKPRFMSLYRNIDSSLSILNYFVQNEFKWENHQMNKIRKAIPEDEKHLFDFNMAAIDWRKYYEQMMIGIKLHLCKEDTNDLPKARNLHLRYKMVRWLSSTIFILLAGRFFFLKSERFRKLWFEALFCIYRFLQYFNVTSVIA